MAGDGYEGRMVTCAAPRRREVCDGEPWPERCPHWPMYHRCNDENEAWWECGPYDADNVCESAHSAF